MVKVPGGGGLQRQQGGVIGHVKSAPITFCRLPYTQVMHPTGKDLVCPECAENCTYRSTCVHGSTTLASEARRRHPTSYTRH